MDWPEDECGNPEDGYWITAPNGETHLYPVPNPRFYLQLKEGIYLPGCDRYGNKLHPRDSQVIYELEQKREREERWHERMIRDMDAEEERYNEAEEMAFLHGGKPEDYL